MVRLHHKLPNSWAQQPRHRVAAVEEFILGDTTAGEFICTKNMTGANKLIDDASKHRNWPFEDTISVFGGEFRRPLAALDRCMLNKGAFAFKIVRGGSKMAAEGRVTLHRGGRNSRFDCTFKSKN